MFHVARWSYWDSEWAQNNKWGEFSAISAHVFSRIRHRTWYHQVSR